MEDIGEGRGVGLCGRAEFQWHGLSRSIVSRTALARLCESYKAAGSFQPYRINVPFCSSVTAWISS